MAAYSFLDVEAAITGPGGTISLGSESGAAEEGITVAMAEDKGTMTLGAGGDVMHSLHAGKSGTVTVRLLKTSPVNQKLSQMYALQTASSAAWGVNTLVIRNPSRGDVITCREAAFKKSPDVVYAKVGNTNEWTFNVGKIDQLLGSGTPSL